MQASGLAEFTPFICTAAFWGHPVSLFTLLLAFLQLLSNHGWGRQHPVDCSFGNPHSHLEARNRWWLWHFLLINMARDIFISQCDNNCLTASLWGEEGKALICSICWFPWFCNAHHGQFQATNMTLTSSENPWKYNHWLLWTSMSQFQYTTEGIQFWKRWFSSPEASSQGGISYYLQTFPKARRKNVSLLKVASGWHTTAPGTHSVH